MEVFDPRYPDNVLDVPPGRELHRLALAGWQAVDPSQRVSVKGTRDGEVDAETVPFNEYSRRWRDGGGNFEMVDFDTAVAIQQQVSRAASADIAREEESGVLATTVGRLATFSSQFDFGLSEYIGRTLSEDGGDLLDRARARDPFGNMVAGGLGFIGSMALGAGAMNAARFAGTGALAMRAGLAGERVAATLGATGRLGQTIGRNIGQAAVVAPGMALTESIARNTPLDAEGLVADTALDLGVGLGLDMMLPAVGAMARGVSRATRTAGERAANIMRRTPASREIVHGGRLAALETGIDFNTAAIDDVARVLTDVPMREQYADRGPFARFFEPLQEMSTGRAVGELNSPTMRQAYGPAIENLEGRHAIDIANSLNRVEDAMDAVVSVAAGPERFAMYADDFAQRASMLEHARVRFADETMAMRSFMHSAVQNPAITRGGERARTMIEEQLQKFRATTERAESMGDLYVAVRDLEDGLGNITDQAYTAAGSLSRADKDMIAEVGRQLTGVMSGPRVRVGIRNDPALWGNRVVDAEAARGEVLGSLMEMRKSTSSLRETAVGSTENIVSARKVSTALGKIGKETGEDVYQGLVNYQSIIRSNAETLARHFGVDSAAVKVLKEESEALTRKLAKASSDARVARAYNVALANETKLGQAGLIGMATGGVGGLAAGEALGHSRGLATAIGALTGGMLSHSLRPASSNIRIGAWERLRDNFMKRKFSALRSFRDRITSAVRSRSSVRLGRAAPLVAYNLRSYKDSKEEYLRLEEDLSKLTPDVMMDNIMASTMAVQGDDPELASAMADVYVRGASYLQQTLPPRAPSISVDPMHTLPSRTEMDAFIEGYIGVVDPLSMLEAIADGSITQERLNAVQAVYPQMHADMVNDLIDVISEFKPGELPYQTRIHMSAVLGTPFDRTLDVSFQAAMQNNGAQTSQQHQANISPSSSPPSMVTSELSRTQQTLNEAPL